MLTKNSILMIFCIICYGTYNEGRTACRQYLVPTPWTVCLQGGLWQTDGQTQRQTHMVVCIHDDKQNGWVQSSHEAEQRAQTVAVNWRAVVEMPQAAFCTCRQVTHQLYTHGGVIYSTRVNRGHRRSDCSHTWGVIYSTWVNRGHHRSDCSHTRGGHIFNASHQGPSQIWLAFSARRILLKQEKQVSVASAGQYASPWNQIKDDFNNGWQTATQLQLATRW